MNKKLKPTLVLLLYLVVILCSTLLSGCTEDLLFDMAEEWAIENRIYDGDETINYVNLGRELTDDAIDSFFGDETQAQLDSGEVVDDIRKADELANAGAISGDISLIDEAILMRPNDWSYMEKRSAVLFSQGDIKLWNESLNNSEALVQESIANGADCTRAYRNMFQHRVAALEQQLEYYPNDEGIANQLAIAQFNLENSGKHCE